MYTKWPALAEICTLQVFLVCYCASLTHRAEVMLPMQTGTDYL